MRSLVSLALPVFLAASLVAAPALAWDGSRDQVAFGGDVYVPAGQTVDSVTAFGGDVVVEGEVLGDVVALGGDVTLAPGSHVGGSVSTMGGQLAASPGATLEGGHETHEPVQIEGFERTHHGGIGDFFGDAIRSAIAHGLLFLLALLMIGLVPERLGALQVTMVRDPLRTFGYGVVAYIAAFASIVLLAITIIGIPAAIALALVIPLVTWVGLASAATVIGAALPVDRLRGRPMLQVAAGIAVLWVASLVPFFGGIVIAVVSCFGLGALARTRFAPSVPEELRGLGPLAGDGPFRTPASL